jgi:mannose-6-phosphate isomerase
METQELIYKLRGKVMNYAWGGYDFIPSLLGIKNDAHQPYAEYWMGAHPLASSELISHNSVISLHDAIAADPNRLLSETVEKRFGGLPFLFKVQDVKDILSIQVHPSKSEAEKGFDREEEEGIPLNAPNRNYKDRNHKPEMLVALSEFWLLHGFKSLSEIEQTLELVPEFNILEPLFKREGLKALFQFVMEMDQDMINAILTTLIKRDIRRKKEGELTKEMPGWWVARIFEGKAEIGNIDRAIFSIYFFNIVKLHAGEGLFQGAGMPHAYMEGQCVELMANSDNVLRAGLTPKYIDVPELLKHTLFESVVPNIMKGNSLQTGEMVYPCPVEDFGIAKIDINPTISYQSIAKSFEILIVIEGGVSINNNLVLKKGEAAGLLPGADYTIRSSGNSTLFKAFVPGI